MLGGLCSWHPARRSHSHRGDRPACRMAPDRALLGRPRLERSLFLLSYRTPGRLASTEPPFWRGNLHNPFMLGLALHHAGVPYYGKTHVDPGVTGPRS